MTALVIAEVSDQTVGGEGAFDVLMTAVKAHLEAEFTKSRIKGPEYSTVYLGSMQLAMQTALQFVLKQRTNEREALLLDQQIALETQKVLNAIQEHAVLVAQECKLQAEFDLIVGQTARTAQELLLLTQKTATEKAQTQTIGVDDDSVVGKQKLLYAAQTAGFARDAEQKAAKLMVDSWSVRRTTDEATVADGTNNLNDEAVGRAVDKLLEGVGA
jgi:hypothetical protein